MKILLVHPDDSIETSSAPVGAEAGPGWDWIVDLGWSGRPAYSQLSEILGIRVLSIYNLLDHEQHHSRMRSILELGLDQVVDSESIDWWDAFSVYPYQQLDQLLLLSALAAQIPDGAEIFATRPGFSLDALSLLTHRKITSLSERRKNRLVERISRYWKAASSFPASQLAEIAFDKWDTDYGIRRHFVRPPRKASTPAILLPSAYANVSRAQVAYARMLPHRRFLLVLTRRNGQIQDLPRNVEVLSLASYATGSADTTNDERLQLLTIWQKVQNDLFETNGVLSAARKLHVFDGFANFLKSGLRIRDAWREVFARENISTVLSADENNPYTRMPILLSRSKKLRTVFCDHGALNMSFGIRRPASDTYLMRGDMARDYGVTRCGLPAGIIVVGAAAETSRPTEPSNHTEQHTERDWIVYYSEAYELSNGRTETFYAELLPELCRLASRMNCKVIVKLHPFESFRMRKALIDNVVSGEQRNLIQIREGPMIPELFARAQCSLTVESSVAVESTLNGVPCFLCSWFDNSWYDYGKQYAKYSAGYRLASPQQIRDIPHLLEQFRIKDATRQSLQTSITAEHLDSVLSRK
jgi:hypothetical protein